MKLSSEKSEWIQALVSEMTLEEKAGQMTQLTLEALSSSPQTNDGQLVLDTTRMKEAFGEKHIGSVLNVFAQSMSKEEWRNCISTLQEQALSNSRLDIPMLYGIDAVHGANYTTDGTLFPQNINLGATWNRALVRDLGAHTALELEECSIPWNFSPVLDLGRHPMWSRFSETFGEDSFLASELGRQSIHGLQDGPSSVSACAKHFIGYGQGFTGRDRTQAWIPDRELRELYLPPFRAAVQAGVMSVMVNSGEVNGVPVHADPVLLTQLLRVELGFEGVIVTDWEDVGKLHTIHRVADSEKEATYLAIQAGIDMSMVPFSADFAGYLVELVHEGRISESRLDASVTRILEMKTRLGLFQQQKKPIAPQNGALSKSGANLSLEAAQQSMVLLENRASTLPIQSASRMFIAGGAADSLAQIHGSWTYTWQGNDESVYPDQLQTVRSVMNRRFTCVETASKADYILYCLGEPPSVEKPGDIDALNWDASQVSELVSHLESGVPVVLVLFTGRPLLVSAFESNCAAIIWAGQPGPKAGAALADIVSGSISPSGRLPFTYPRHPAIFHTYDHKWSDRVGDDYGLGREYTMDGFNPQWQFGHGESYADIRYTDLLAVEQDGYWEVSVRIHNQSTFSVRENVLLFISDTFASITPVVKRLKGFQSIELMPNEAQSVSFQLPIEAFGFVDVNHKLVVEKGEFVIRVGHLHQAIVLKETFALDQKPVKAYLI